MISTAEIKKTLSAELNIPWKDLRVRRGKGTASTALYIQVRNLTTTLMEQIREQVIIANDLDWVEDDGVKYWAPAYDSDYDSEQLYLSPFGSEQLDLSILDLETGLRPLRNHKIPNRQPLPNHDWTQEGF